MKELQQAYRQALSAYLKLAVESVNPWSTTDTFYKEIEKQMVPDEGEPGCYEVRILCRRYTWPIWETDGTPTERIDLLATSEPPPALLTYRG
jgi:hypothetical protein